LVDAGWGVVRLAEERTMTIVDGGNAVRLRQVSLDEYERVASPWYQDPEVLRLSEGGSAPYDRATIRLMFESLTRQGELYLIEVLDEATWRPVGDAALMRDSVPIMIGRPEDRSRGIGTEVVQLLLLRARALGWREVHASNIDPANVRVQRLFARAGFTVNPAAPRTGPGHIGMTRTLGESPSQTGDGE
jgi:RimJ/RimL family protein N-acetyltransferase